MTTQMNVYKLIAIFLSKKQVLDVNPKAIQKLNFNGNLQSCP